MLIHRHLENRPNLIMIRDLCCCVVDIIDSPPPALENIPHISLVVGARNSKESFGKCMTYQELGVLYCSPFNPAQISTRHSHPRSGSRTTLGDRQFWALLDSRGRVRILNHYGEQKVWLSAYTYRTYLGNISESSGMKPWIPSLTGLPSPVNSTPISFPLSSHAFI